jgi:hypothetical protein
MKTYRPLSSIAIAGNIMFILWITYNGIDEGFSATPIQIFVYIALIILLILNIILLSHRRPKN